MPNSLDEALALADESVQEITVDYINKVLIVPNDLKVAGVKGDKDSRRLHFRVVKKPDELDLMQAVIEVKYANALGETGRQMVTDAVETDGEVTFSFLIPATLAKEKGTASIQLCAHTDDAHWHISPYQITIGDFVEVSEITEDDPKYDIVTQLLNAYQNAGGQPGEVTGGMTVAQADARYYKKTDTINVTLTDAQKAELKGEKGDKGDTGETGPKGDTGPQGPKGEDGTMTFADLTDEQKASLKGEKGDKGEDGTYQGVTETTMTATDTTATLEPNIFYVFPEMASLTINFGAPTAGVTNEYHFSFVSGATATTLTMPATVKGLDDLTAESGKTYEISVQNGIGVWIAV